jgi:hypothetical protein
MNKYLATGLLTILLTVLFTGIYQDSEFHEKYLFTKHKPSFQLFFYSPIGESDMSIKELPAEKQKEESAFDEFVTSRSGSFVFEKLDFMPVILILLSLILILKGLVKLIRSKRLGE